MNLLKKILFFTFIVLIFTSNGQNAYCKTIKKDIEVQTKDLKIIKATLSYVKMEGVNKYPTVLLLHSLGYLSENWGDLIPNLNNAGYAVIAMDLRGHGKSIYNTNFKQRTWSYFTNKDYQNCPNDVLLMLKEAKNQSKVVSLDNLAIVGADIGANTAILVAKAISPKPKTLVLISPSTTFKGLYTPIALAEMGAIPVLSMASKQDNYSLKGQQELSKFAQGGFYAQNYPYGGMGMLMIKTNPEMSKDITRWIIKYLK